jgi:hypothetical protein
MAATSRDPHNNRELARVVYLGFRAARREARGKSTKRIDNEVERIRTKAQAREDAKRQK